MTTDGLPPAGRAIERAVTDLGRAVAGRDEPALRDGCERLRGYDEVLVRDVLHRLTLGLVERAYPDGLDGDDIRTLFGEVARPAAPWLGGLDPDAVLIVLAGALGVHPPEDAPRPSLDQDALPIACALVVDELLRRLGARLGPELTRTFDELRVAQTMEMP
ncbi:hypothetical protein I6A60_19825 [Frankia sp. AgB1.9]|uniref:hypothetical protein n=1 Tax=unclassified Frankia TaxID=2632575 RepID=UPI001933BBD6|nr:MULTISPECIES: hypothetical protein [unclassified Frankia]MBL7494429.1 hypothetical protein [Frankia sp. AgW1.1]MBL7550112.1 hypothetical protein [Frankia sp. AgB1.9]MBL7621144.1 hypothetical protein [Frankia sp. AgB1.8]